ncbi:hypothetical protein DJ568_16755 [Mucilaginibacter hurinus]|uniref:Pentapeptide repeat-containing protein n=1 Tax=Mucilaginibacter hurinus TaxID=2201324 RepID=A0A367GL14_9SPHI|nr:hypothetical protein [Mucilaginibacter hurinus]RCH53685.1 hypothetical protein DJ568_16755 [Mucilaginibacter hurinus]
MDLMNPNNDFFKVVSSENDLLEILKEQSQEFKFLSVRFTIDIDLYAIVSENPIPGIILLERKFRGPKPDMLKELSPIFDCSDIQFDKPISFWNCHFSMHTNFQNSIFKHGFNFRLSTFENGLSMTKVIAEGKSTFGFISSSSVMIMNCFFAVIDNQYSELNVDGDFHINNTTINSELNLYRCKITGQLNLIGIKLNGNLDVSEATIANLNLGVFEDNTSRTELQNFNIAYTEFQGNVQIRNLNINGKVSGQGAVFKDNIFFTNLNFTNHVYLTHSIIDKPIYFDNVCAKGNFSFYGSTLNADIRLTDVDFTNANVSFTGSQINADLWIGSLLNEDSKVFNGKMNFQGAIISAKSIVRVFNLNNPGSPAGEIKFSNVIVRGLVDVKNVYVSKITFDGTIVSGNIQDDNSFRSAIVDRDTARLLKHEARKINNIISALSYNKIEMKLHADNLSIWKFTDWSMLKLNQISNNYGSNWLWGAGFTITCALFCYSIFTLSIFGFGFFWEDNWSFLYTDSKFWAGFINYFWLPTGFNELTKNGVVQGGGAGGVTYIIGKILIAYGIYQTVAAFRKYV